MDAPLWENLFQRTKLKSYLSSVIEVGLSRYGPTLAISGTMTALKKVAFVYHMHIRLFREKDAQELDFDWFAFRPHKYQGEGYKGIEMKMPSRFMITSTQVYKYNILFFDRNQYSEMNPLLKEVQSGWEKAINRRSLTTPPGDHAEMFKEFVNSKAIKPYRSDLQKMTYWKVGEYSLTVEISTHSKGSGFDIFKSFVLNGEDVQNLERNIDIIIADLCRQKSIAYNFAYPALV